MPKYALRYAPLLLLALLLIPLRLYIGQHDLANATSIALTHPLVSAGTVLYSVTELSDSDVWMVGGRFTPQVDVRKATGQFGIFDVKPVTTTLPAKPVQGIILHYVDGEQVRVQVSGVLHAPLLSVSLDSARDGWAVGYAGTFVHYNGKTWSTVAGPAHFKQTLRSVVMLSPSDGWAVGDGGAMLHYDGMHWTQVQVQTTNSAQEPHDDLYSIAMISPQEGWAVGDNGRILHYSQGSWRSYSSPTAALLTSVALLPGGDGWAVGMQSTILHLRDGVWGTVYPANYSQSAKVDAATAFYGVAMTSLRTGSIIGDQRVLVYAHELWSDQDTVTTSPNVEAYKRLVFDRFTLYGEVLSSSGDNWLVGSIEDSTGGRTMVAVRYREGDTLSVYTPTLN